MSSSTERRPTKRERQQSAREEKAAKMRAEAARKQAQRRTMIATGVVLALIAVVIGVFVVVQSARRNNTASSAAIPANLAADNSVVVGTADAKVTMIAYEDFQCPVCRAFEQVNGTQIAGWISDGTLKVEYRPIAFLDRSSTTRYSTRALDAAAAVVNSTPSAFAKFHQLLYANQPAEGSAGLTDAKLAALAGQAGASQQAVSTALKNKTYEGWAAKATEASSKAGVTGTPTVKINGKQLPDTITSDPNVLKLAVEAAAK